MNQQRKDDLNMHKKILRIATLALAFLLLVTVLPQESFANDLEIKEIKNQITSTYKAAKRYSGRPSFSGYCASLVNWQLYLLSSHTEFERTFGRTADKKRKLYNGMIKCDYYMYTDNKRKK